MAPGHTSSTAGEGRVLRSRSGRVVTEQALAEAVQQAATLNAPSKRCAALARGLGTAADATLQHVKMPAETSDNSRPKRQCRGRPARAGAAQPTCSLAPAPAQCAAQDTDAARPDGSAHPALTLAATPAAWTEASMASALEHLCKADSREALPISAYTSCFPLPAVNSKEGPLDRLKLLLGVCSIGGSPDTRVHA